MVRGSGRYAFPGTASAASAARGWRGVDIVRAADAGWDLGDAALVARALADLSAQLPAVIATVKTAVDHAGTPVEPGDVSV
jgi:hypothetical protein